MSGNATCSQEELQGAIEEYAASLHPAYLDLLTNAVFASLMLPFLLSLFYFSSGYRRRSLMFVLVVMSVVIALVQYVYEMSLRLDSLYHPQQASTSLTPAVLTSILVLRDLPNFVADLALFARMLVVYPSHMTSRRTLLAVFVPSILIKIIRVVSMVIIYVYDGQDKQGAGLYIYWSAWEQTWLIANRAFAALDNTYPTACFLWKIKTAFISDRELGRVTMNQKDTITGRIRTLFWIALTNFVIPVPLYVAQLGQAIANSNSTTFAYFQQYIVFSSVICVSFATIWASTLPVRTAIRQGSHPDPSIGTSLNFRPMTTNGTPADQTSSQMLPTPRTSKKPQEYPLQIRVDLSQETI